MATDQSITFSSNYRPALLPGKYEFSVRQESGPAKETDRLFESNKQTVVIEAPRFTLDPAIIHSVYPLAGAKGSFMADLPSIAFHRASLPWERRRAGSGKENESWLCLFLVDAEHAALLEEGTCMASELFGNLQEHEETRVNYLKIPAGLRQQLFPRDEEWQYLAHCRTGQENARESQSVLLGNRLPRPGSINTVYLLSVENRKEESSSETYVYLHKWRFYCEPNNSYLVPKDSKDTALQSLKGRLFKDEKAFEKAVKESKESKESIEDLDPAFFQSLKVKYRVEGGGFHDLLKGLPGKLSNFGYPVPPEELGKMVPQLKTLVSQGGVLLKENDTYKPYRGPLQAAPVEFHWKTNDLAWTGLKKYYKEDAPDRSYAVAYELGVLTALKDDEFHRPFYAWKQEVSAAFLAKTTQLQALNSKTAHLQNYIRNLNPNKPMPPVVLEKIENWKMLKGIPYSYLIPSANMLPAESIRCFFLDTNWVNAFLLGAFSIGSTYESIEKKLLELYQPLFLATNRSGFLVHSLAVSGWPDYTAEATLKKGGPTLLLDRKKLATNIEMFLYEGDTDSGGALTTLTFLPPRGKTLHGFRYENEAFKKQFRNPITHIDMTLHVAFHTESLRTVDIKALLTAAGATPSSAFFGMMMLEGTPMVVFNLAPV